MATKKYNAIGHIDRINNPIHRVVFKVPRSKRQQLTKSKIYDEKIGRVVSKTTFADVDTSSLSKYKVSDFSIENLEAIDALGNLSRVSMTSDNLSTVDYLSKQLSNLKPE